MDEENFYAETRGDKYHLGSPNYGFIGSFVEYDDVIEAMKEWSEENNFYPELYFVSDHGNIDEKPTFYGEDIPLPF